MTSINGNTKVFIYEEGYLRTSCREYSINNLANKFVHLTNDAIQVHADDYGKFENGNKMAFSDFTKVIQQQQPDIDFDMYRDIVPQIKKLVTDTFRCSVTKIDPTRL